MSNNIIDKAMGFLRQPAKAFDNEAKTDVMDSFIYLAVLGLVMAILSALMTAVYAGPFMAGASFVVTYIGLIIMSVIFSLWLHVWAYIFGAKKGVLQTLKSTIYGGTPFYVLGWIPFIGFLAGLWSLYLQWLGLKALHTMPGDKAAIAIAIAVLIPLIVMAVLLAAVFAFLPFASLYGTMPPEIIPT